MKPEGRFRPLLFRRWRREVSDSSSAKEELQTNAANELQTSATNELHTNATVTKIFPVQFNPRPWHVFEPVLFCFKQFHPFGKEATVQQPGPGNSSTQKWFVCMYGQMCCYLDLFTKSPSDCYLFILFLKSLPGLYSTGWQTLNICSLTVQGWFNFNDTFRVMNIRRILCVAVRQLPAYYGEQTKILEMKKY